jgi:hypothetical protein
MTLTKNIKICRKCQVPKLVTEFPVYEQTFNKSIIVYQTDCNQCQGITEKKPRAARKKKQWKYYLNGIEYTFAAPTHYNERQFYHKYLINDKDEKLCRECQIVKVKDDFDQNNTGVNPDGLNLICRICISSIAKREEFNLKRCSKCNLDLKKDNFYPNARYTDGYNPFCMECKKKLYKIRYEKIKISGRKASTKE